jgi:hypothetical protein
MVWNLKVMYKPLRSDTLLLLFDGKIIAHNTREKVRTRTGKDVERLGSERKIIFKFDARYFLFTAINLT